MLLVCLQSAISRCLEGHNDEMTMSTVRVLAGMVGDDFDFLLRLSKCCSGCRGGKNERADYRDVLGCFLRTVARERARGRGTDSDRDSV